MTNPTLHREPLPPQDDPILIYRQSDRDFNRRTYYMIIGLWLFIASMMTVSYFH